MRAKILWSIVGCLLVVTLVLASCAPAAQPTAPKTPVAPAAASPAKPTVPTVAPVPTSAAAEEPKYGGTVTVAFMALLNIDPYRQDAHGMRAMSLVLEKLAMGDWAVDRKVYDFPNETGYVPYKYMKGQLLESWETPDYLTAILHVRKGVRFQDKPPVNGRELVADDVIWTFQRNLQSPFTTKDYISRIDTLKALDKYTVEIKLKPPPRVPAWALILDMHAMFVVPRESVGTANEVQDWRNIVGTGPFTLQDYVGESAATFKKNPNYWGYDELHPNNKLPYVDTIKWLIIPDLATRLTALRTGRIEWLGNIDQQTAAGVITGGMQRKLSPQSRPAAIRVRVDKPPFTDVRVRQALSMAIDRQEMIKTVFAGYATPLT